MVATFFLLFAFMFSAFGIGAVGAQSGGSDPCAGYSGSFKNKCRAVYSKCTQGVTNVTELSRCAATTSSLVDAMVKACDIRVNKSACEQRLIRCDTVRCVQTAARAFPAVRTVCRGADNPQNCHRAVERECAGRTGEQLRTCRAETAVEFAGAGNTARDGQQKLLAADQEVNGRCGEGDNAIQTSIDFGCTGKGNPIVDLAYAIIKFLSFGVGLIIAASIIYAGIQYSASSGNPENSQNAKNRIINSLVGLVFYLLIFAFVQFLVPGGLFNSP